MATAAQTLEVRYNIGDTEVPYELSDTIIESKIDAYTNPPLSDQQIIYYATIDCLRLLKAKFAISASRRRERRGSEEIEEYRGEKYKAICDLLQWWEGNPPAGIVSKAAGHIIGGISKEKVAAAKNNSDSNGPRVGIGWFDENQV